MLKSVFIGGLTRFYCLVFGDNCKNKWAHSHCQWQKCSSETIFSSI